MSQLSMSKEHSDYIANLNADNLHVHRHALNGLQYELRDRIDRLGSECASPANAIRIEEATLIHDRIMTEIAMLDRRMLTIGQRVQTLLTGTPST